MDELLIRIEDVLNGKYRFVEGQPVRRSYVDMGTENMKYKVGDKVRIKSLDWYNENKDTDDVVRCENKIFDDYMSVFCGSVVTIGGVYPYNGYDIREDMQCRIWTDEMIEGLVEEETKPEFKVGDEVIAYAEGCIAQFSIKDVRWNSELNKFEYKICSSWYDASVMQLYKKSDNFLIERNDDNGLPFNEWLSHKGAFYVPNEYEIKDEKGNIINTTKIVLEKKKKEYPKTYEECCKILEDVADCSLSCFACGLLNNLQKLLLCRNAYWKIAGDEMRLGEPWRPDWTSTKYKYCITTRKNKVEPLFEMNVGFIFAFPTEKMRDAFKENFDNDLEFCKELL